MFQEKVLFEKALSKVYFVLKFTGLHLMNENSERSFLGRLRNRWWLCFYIVWCNSDLSAELAWFINGALTGKGLVELTYPAPSITQCLLGNIKTYYFIQNEHHINNLIDTLSRMQSDDSDPGNVRREVEDEFMGTVSWLNKIVKTQFWLNISALGGFAVLPFLIMALTYNTSGKIELVLPFVVLYPFDVFDQRIWPFVYAREMFTATVMVFMVFGPDSLYYTCCTFIQIKFRSLQYDIERLIKKNTIINHHNRVKNNVFRSKFVLLIERHCELIRYVLLIERHCELIRCVSLIEYAYCKSTLFNVVSSSFIICLTGFNVTAIDYLPLMMPFIAFLMLSLFQIYLFCYFGDIIIRSSTGVSEAVYNCQWYNVENNAMKDFNIVLTRAQRPCKLTAFGFSEISLKTFTRILSTSWSYFALLNSVNR